MPFGLMQARLNLRLKLRLGMTVHNQTRLTKIQFCKEKHPDEGCFFNYLDKKTVQKLILHSSTKNWRERRAADTI